ncbi:hypothetical protein C8R43DRAFT_1234838, partial [Mycena crocata]
MIKIGTLSASSSAHRSHAVSRPGLKPFVDTRLLKSSSASKRNNNKEVARSAGPPSAPSSEARSKAALVSQSDLFLRCKVEVDEQSMRPDRGRPIQKEWDSKLSRERDTQRDRDRDRHRAHDGRDPTGNSDGTHKTYPKNQSISPVRQYAKKYNRTASDTSKKSELDANRNRGPVKQSVDLAAIELNTRAPESSGLAPKPKVSVDSKADFTSISAQNSKWGAPSAEMVPKMDVVPSVEVPVQVSEERKRAEKLMGLFRSLARLSNQVVQDTAAHEREGQKLQTYTEISSALSKISSAAQASVAPTLAEVMLKHEQSKVRVEDDFRALGSVWEQVFDVFVKEVVHVIDAGLQDAITTLKKEGEHAVKEIIANAAGSVKHSAAGDSAVPYDRKRARTRGPAEKENEESRSGRGASRDRDHKRRRFASRSSSPDSHDRRSVRHGGGDSIEDILQQMKMKIDQQAHSLQILTKENSEEQEQVGTNKFGLVDSEGLGTTIR